MHPNTVLYEQDFYTWSMTTAALIRARKWCDLDPESLAEEIESLGRSEHHALTSHLKQLVMHLLKWYYQPEKRQEGHSWESTIINARQEITDLLERNPGLRPFLEPELPKVYPLARRLARAETQLPLGTFPETCPWTLDEVRHDDFWPEA